MIRCPICGTVANDEALVCLNCGARFGDTPTSITSRCPRCGAEIAYDMIYCPLCGHGLAHLPEQKIEEKPLEKPAFKTAPERVKPKSFALASSIAEAFVTLVKPTPPIDRPTDVVYKKLAPYTSVKKYLTMGLTLGLLGMLLSTFGLFAIVPLRFIITVSIPSVLYLFWMLKQDRFESEPIELISLSFGWGAFSAFLVMLSWIVLSIDVDIPAWIGGPLPEEPLKILGVYWLATHKRLGAEFNDHLDGLVYGAAAGAGFAFAENFLYVFQMITMGIPLHIAVLIRSSIGHVFYSGLVGRWLGIAKVRRGYIKIQDLIPGLVVAMVLHGLWNSPLLNPILQFFDSIGGGLGVIVAIFLIAAPYYGILFKYTKEALRDEELWGYSMGHAPT